MPEHEIVVDVLIGPVICSPLTPERICEVVVAAARLRGFDCGQIGVRITDDPTIHEINRNHLQHDYPTDVISFDYGSCESTIDGELVVSLETAQKNAEEMSWQVEHELALYIVHGTLHIAGMDDQDSDARLKMRQAEQEVLRRLNVELTEAFSPDWGRQ